jgi:peptidoglycan/xylan/chitin deacetylase (PgdA/CDA1 family)
MNFLARLVDLLLDPRMPYFIPCVKLKRRQRKTLPDTKIPSGISLLIALTFDVEYDFGSSATEASTDAVEPFLRQLPALAREMQSVFTLFVQGDLVNRYGELLLNLQSSHEIGLHGFAHELWGKAKWFLPHKPVSLKSKEELLKQGLKNFADNKLAPPVSFRAPDLVADMDTLRLLQENGFMVDSSAPVYRGTPPLPARPLGPSSPFLSIPITASPVPRLRIRYLLPFTAYEVFNMSWLATADDRHLLDCVAEVVSFQMSNGAKPHLVFLAHPWEFRGWSGNARLNYCSGDNYELLSRKMRLLEERYQLKYVSMKELAQMLGSE